MAGVLPIAIRCEKGCSKLTGKLTGCRLCLHSIRLGFILYYDDLEVCNPLGAFHGTHKLGMFYWTLVNYKAEDRMCFANMHLMTVALASDIDYYGIAQVVSGLAGDSSFGSGMTALDQGVRIPVGESTALCRGWCVCLSADFPAAALCAGFKKSTSAAVFCRECYMNSKEKGYPKPFSFLDDNGNLRCDTCIRDKDEMASDFAHWQSLASATDRDAFLRSIGMNTFSNAFARVPHFDICSMIPWDFMHVELEGSLKNELAAMLYYFIRKRKWGFTLAKLNEAIRKYTWPPGRAPPMFTEGYIEKGTKKGQCNKGTHVHMTAGHMLTFALHSIDLMLPLINDVKDPLWRCWTAHIKYIRLLHQHRITRTELLELNKLIYQHHDLFINACKKEYGKRLFKPKNHFACHFPTDILNFGPVRGYWCMRFEALNLLFKALAKTGDFSNTCGRCAKFWTIRSAMVRELWYEAKGVPTRSLCTLVTVRYQRNPCASSFRQAIIATLFSRSKKLRKSIDLQWVSDLMYSGSHIVAGVAALCRLFFFFFFLLCCPNAPTSSDANIL